MKIQPVFDNHNQRYEDFAYFAARPGHPEHIFANLENEKTIGISTNEGSTWTRMNNNRITFFILMLLSHQSGLCLWDGKLSVSQLSDRDMVLEKLEAATPLWTPGDYSGYSAGLLGFYMSELVRRIDDQQRSIGQYFQDEIAQPLGMEFYIGLPDSISDCRIAHITLAHPIKRIFTMGKLPKGLRRAIRKPGSMFMKSIGAKGSIAFFRKKEYFHKAIEVDAIVDTTGCGDAFQAAFSMEWIKTEDIDKSLKAGSEAASKVLGFMGGVE